MRRAEQGQAALDLVLGVDEDLASVVDFVLDD